MKAIILAGGKGSRFKPLTDTIPKALIPVKESTLIETVLGSLPETITEIIITTSYLPEKISKHLGSSYNNIPIAYTKQAADQNGTWAALNSAKELLTENELFLVLNCDDLFLKKELEQFTKETMPCIGVTETIMPAKYHGIVIKNTFFNDFKRHQNVDKELPITDIFANGLYLLNKKFFSFPPTQLLDGELGIPQTALSNKHTYPLICFPVSYWQPCNTFRDLEKIQ